MFVVYLTPLAASGEDVDALTLGAPVAPKFLAGPEASSRITPALPQPEESASDSEVEGHA